LLLQAQTNDVGITQVLEVIDESDKVYLIMELMTGGNLLSRVVQQEGLSENTVKLVAKSLLLGVRHLHALDICHNGLEPSNILLDSMDGAKIGDFGYASRMGCKAAGAPETAAYKCQYTAPEVLEGDVPNAASDMWSVGVMLYFCLFGQMPFCDQSDVTSINNPSGRTRTVVSRIHKADYSFQFPLAEWNDVDIDVSRYAKQLISSLIHMDPTVRLTADEALEHPWFADANADPADEHESVRGRGHLNRRRRPRIIGTLAKCFWENIGSLCRKKNKDVKQVVFASLSTNSSTPYSDYASMNMNVNMNTRHRREESTSSSMNRFYDIGA
jgi:serine/threonine protein kinase